MKQLTKITFLFFIIAIAFSACTEENYADWKILNDNRYATELATTDFTKSESGLCYKIIYPGEMKRANIDSYVTVKYTLKLITGKIIETGTFTGTLISSNYGSGTIAAWKEAIPLLKVGAVMDMFFSYDLGYGSTASGAVPPYSMLYYSVELLDAQN
jgi:FKBP-type peptidyl-prolyl cis-trans isomerase